MKNATLEPDQESYWGPYFTHFPALARYIPLGAYAERVRPRACVLGVSDGKFALPLLRAGWEVVGVETDSLFLDGGVLELVDGCHTVTGLRERLAAEGLEDRCTIVERDYMTVEPAGDFQLVMGSGLWSMPPNRVHTMRALIDQAMAMVAPAGIFFADYLVGFTPEDKTCGFYPSVEEMGRIVARDGWEVFENVDLGVYSESHLGWEEWHCHRYAAAIAHRFPARVG
ncbi:hypothetical protein [Actinokineospora sp.]|uniref:hypothetical protein n=1 Tax=Actinokineospora sp. TaxID=1872133 RepID=UPI003D6C3D8E